MKDKGMIGDNYTVTRAALSSHFYSMRKDEPLKPSASSSFGGHFGMLVAREDEPKKSLSRLRNIKLGVTHKPCILLKLEVNVRRVEVHMFIYVCKSKAKSPPVFSS